MSGGLTYRTPRTAPGLIARGLASFWRTALDFAVRVNRNRHWMMAAAVGWGCLAALVSQHPARWRGRRPLLPLDAGQQNPDVQRSALVGLGSAPNQKPALVLQLKKPKFLKCGLNHVTTLVEDKTAKLVIIANDVDPIELVMWLPHLCRSKDVPYCFIKSKARLGALVGKKSATCIAVTDLKKEDAAEFEKLAGSCRTLYNANKEHLTKYSDIVLGSRATARDTKAKLAKEAEVTAK